MPILPEFEDPELASDVEEFFLTTQYACSSSVDEAPDKLKSAIAR